MAEIIRNKIINEENPSKYQKGISHVTLDVLDSYADFATKKLLDEIYFYEKFHPELLIKKGLLLDNNNSSSSTSEDDDKKITEYFIPIEINVNLNDINYNDNVTWDLLNNDLIPEIFAENTVKDENLPNEFILPIAYQIRKGIHYYVYELFKNIAKNYQKYEQEYYLENDKNSKSTRHSEEIRKNIPVLIFDGKLSNMLGKKRKNLENINDENLPSFLVNKKEDNISGKNSTEKKKNKKIINSSKKLLAKKNKNMNQIEHDKQSTTMEENE